MLLVWYPYTLLHWVSEHSTESELPIFKFFTAHTAKMLRILCMLLMALYLVSYVSAYIIYRYRPVYRRPMYRTVYHPDIDDDNVILLGELSFPFYPPPPSLPSPFLRFHKRIVKFVSLSQKYILLLDSLEYYIWIEPPPPFPKKTPKGTTPWICLIMLKTCVNLSLVFLNDPKVMWSRMNDRIYCTDIAMSLTSLVSACSLN